MVYKTVINYYLIITYIIRHSEMWYLSSTIISVTTPNKARPAFHRWEYDEWKKTAKELGYSGPWKLMRKLMKVAKANPETYRKD